MQLHNCWLLFSDGPTLFPQPNSNSIPHCRENSRRRNTRMLKSATGERWLSSRQQSKREVYLSVSISLPPHCLLTTPFVCFICFQYRCSRSREISHCARQSTPSVPRNEDHGHQQNYPGAVGSNIQRTGHHQHQADVWPGKRIKGIQVAQLSCGDD